MEIIEFLFAVYGGYKLGNSLGHLLVDLIEKYGR
jgi:hypothetical protein